MSDYHANSGLELDLSELTVLLQRWREGDKHAEAALFEQVYPVFRGLARNQLDRLAGRVTLQVTDLVHEAYEKLVRQQADWQNRAHFYAISARVIRRVLIDYLRERDALKRGGEHQFVELDAARDQPTDELLDRFDWLILDQVLTEFERMDPQCARLIELRYFAGLTVAEAAESLAVSVPTAVRMWRFARAWLAARMDPDGQLAKR